MSANYYIDTSITSHTSKLQYYSSNAPPGRHKTAVNHQRSISQSECEDSSRNLRSVFTVPSFSRLRMRRKSKSLENLAILNRLKKRGVVDNIRGAKESIVSKPKELVHMVKNKFGSADNISNLKLEEGTSTDLNPNTLHTERSGSAGVGIYLPSQTAGPGSRGRSRQQSEDGEDAVSSVSSGSHRSQKSAGQGSSHPSTSHPERPHQPPASTHSGQAGAPDKLASSGSTSGGHHHLSSQQQQQYQLLNNQLMHHSGASHQSQLLHSQQFDPQYHYHKLVDEFSKLSEEIAKLRVDMESERENMRQFLDEQVFKNERMEEQINDLTELHQHEVSNIKQELLSMEEKMEYQLEERTRDMQEMLETCQTRITKMELQQQQQQLISMEGIDNSNFRNLITKLINVVLAVLAVLLVLVATVAQFLGPFLTTRVRILSTIILITSIVLMWQNWSYISLHTFSKFSSSSSNSGEGDSTPKKGWW